jgi:DNA-binding NarL/FixJ family response regulator
MPTPDTDRKLRVLIADDHPLMREGIAGVLEDTDDIEVVARAADGLAAIDLYRLHRPDVTLMDLMMPHCSGLEAIARIRADDPGACILALSTYDGEAHVRRALDAGAAGYVLKSTVCEDVARLVRDVHAGRRVMSSELLPSLSSAQTSRLTARERDVLMLVAQGNTNRAVGEQLGIAEETVKGYLSTVMQKLQARDRAHAVAIALSRGDIDA